AGLGATIQPAAAMRATRDQGLRSVALADRGARRRNLLASLSDDELSPAALATRVAVAGIAPRLVAEGRWPGASIHETCTPLHGVRLAGAAPGPRLGADRPEASIPMNRPDVLVIGGGNAALCAAISAREAGASVLLLEASPRDWRGGNSQHTRNLRCMHEAPQDVLTDAYPEEEFWQDLLKVTRSEEHTSE